MPAPCAFLDHITVAALTLEDGIAHIERELGANIPPGGAHPLMATHNHLMQLGDKVFLELIAPDPAAKPQRARWFGLDDPAMLARLQGAPRLITWVARVSNLKEVLEMFDGTLGEAVRVTRGDLSWLISVPHDGSLPFGGAFPTLIQWPEGPHPSLRMAGLDCRLERLMITHPEAARLARALRRIMANDRIEISVGDQPGLRAAITTPSGSRILT